MQNMIRAAWKECGPGLNLGQFSGREKAVTHTHTPAPDGSDKHRCKIKVDGKRLELPFPAPTALPTTLQVQSSTAIATLAPTFLVPKPDMDVIRALARRSDRRLLDTEQVTLQQLCDKYHKQRTRKMAGLPAGTGYQVEGKEQGSSRAHHTIPHGEDADPETNNETKPQLFAFVGELSRKIPFYLGLGTFSEATQEVEFQYLGFPGQGKSNPCNAEYKLAWLDPVDGKTAYATSRPGQKYSGIKPCTDISSLETDVLTRYVALTHELIESSSSLYSNLLNLASSPTSTEIPRIL
jgi:hypothetical protein